MAAFLGFILAMTLIVAAGPAVGLLLGVAFAGVWLWLGEKLENAVHGFSQEPASEKAGGVNLPEQLLSTRRRPFRVETHEGALPRVYLIPAKHAGAATMKARRWGVKVERVTEVGGDES